MSFNRNRGLRRAVALLCGVSAAALSPTLLAQDQAGPDKNIDEVVVTGSRIARPNLESPVPVTTVTAEELFETGSTSVGDLLNDLPSLRSTFSQSNSSRFLGTTGLNLLDLRGLGTQRTLVLLNGRRHVGSDILEQRRVAGHEHVPDRPHRAHRRRHRRQLRRLRLGRHRGRRELRAQEGFRRSAVPRPGRPEQRRRCRQLLRQRPRGHELHGRSRQHRDQPRVREAGTVLRLGS